MSCVHFIGLWQPMCTPLAVCQHKVDAPPFYPTSAQHSVLSLGVCVAVVRCERVRAGNELGVARVC
jgi:hypothetical protein